MLSIKVEITGTDAGYTGRDIREIFARVAHDMASDETAGTFHDGLFHSVTWRVSESRDPDTAGPCTCRCREGRHCGGCGHAGCGYTRDPEPETYTRAGVTYEPNADGSLTLSDGDGHTYTRV